MRYFLLRWLAALVCLSVFSVRQTSAAPKSDQPDDPNFSGAWALDLKASTSFETLMNQIGATLLDRKYAASVKLKATIQQTAPYLYLEACEFARALLLVPPVARSVSFYIIGEDS